MKPSVPCTWQKIIPGSKSLDSIQKLTSTSGTQMQSGYSTMATMLTSSWGTEIDKIAFEVIPGNDQNSLLPIRKLPEVSSNGQVS